jgi:glycosyltransferase involved in cell wall biosynthesis
MHVLWFTDVMPSAARRHLGFAAEPGPQAWVDNLAEALRSVPGLRLAIAAPSPETHSPFEDRGIEYLCLLDPVPTSRVMRIARGWRHQLTAQRVLESAADLVRRRRPDVVHVHGAEGPFGAISSAVAPIPCVISVQGIVQLYQRVYFSGRTADEMVRMVASGEFLKGRGLVHEYFLMRRKAAREVRIMRGARWFVGRTQWDRGVAAALNPRAQFFHCDEIMRSEFYDAVWSTPGGAGARVYSTSSSMLFKGTEALLEAAAVLRRQRKLALDVRISGVPPDSELERLYRRTAARWGVGDAVRWLGRLDARSIVAELRAADAFAYPTHIDNSPNALVEAMLVGVPSVASCVGGIPSLMTDGEDGLLVPRGDAVALAGAIARLLDDRAEAVRLGAAARVRALQRNDPSVIAARMAAIYEEIVTRSTGRSMACAASGSGGDV